MIQSSWIKRLIIILSSVGTFCLCQSTGNGKKSSSWTRIVGGSDVTQNSYPWFTALTYKDDNVGIDRIICGGMLISPHWVLTAAHCVVRYYEFKDVVHIGAFHSPYTENDNGGQYVEVKDLLFIVTHPDYDEVTLENDIALLRLNGTSSITPANIDYAGISMSYSTGYSDLWTIGRGNIEENKGQKGVEVLKHANIKYVSNDDCWNRYDYEQHEIGTTMMCAMDIGKDSCQGDSGGPLYDSQNDVVVGIVSWGTGCARETHPGVYSRIYSNIGWIEEMMAPTASPTVFPSLTPTPVPLYTEVSSDNCEDYGYYTITSIEECLEGANSLGRTVTWGPHSGILDAATGCTARFSTFNTKLYFNSPETCDPNHAVSGMFYSGCKCAKIASCICRTKPYQSPIPITSSPSPPSTSSEPTCVDSEMRFKVNVRGKDMLRSCVFIGKNKNNRCKKAAARHFCALSCGNCGARRCQDSTGVFQIVRKSDGKRINRDCSYATKWRCNNNEGYAEACPMSCGKCTSLG